MAVFKWNGDAVIARFKSVAVARVESAAGVLADAMRAQCPVLTGQLRDSIRETPPELVRDTAVASVVVEASYAQAVEYGTRFAPAHPFVRVGLEVAKSDVGRILTAD